METRIGMPMKVMDPEACWDSRFVAPWQDFSVPGVLESPLGEAGKKRLKKAREAKCAFLSSHGRLRW